MLERNHLIFKPLKPNTVQVFAGDPFQKLGGGGASAPLDFEGGTPAS